MKKRGRSAPPLTLFLLSIQRNTTEYNGKNRKTDAKSPIRARKTTFSAEKTARMSSKRRKAESAKGRHARRGEQGKKDEPRQIQPFSLPNRAARRQATDHKKAPWNPYGKREKREARRHLILLETFEICLQIENVSRIDRKPYGFRSTKDKTAVKIEAERKQSKKIL